MRHPLASHAARPARRLPARGGAAGAARRRADPERGRVLIADYGCHACHRIPGVRQASGSVGPPLDGFGRRAYIAGILPNRPMLLTWWLRDPPALDPRTAMPALGLSEPEARHMAAYLYTLR